MFKSLLILLLFVFSAAFADTVEIDINPKEPIMGESFDVIFKISTQSTKEPDIQFEPQGVQVLGKSFAGRSTRTTFFNGKLQTESTLNYKYQMTPEKVGNAYLKNILVKIDGQKFESKNLRIRILSQPKTEAPVFLVAEPSKDQVFLKESVVVNYYIYYRVGLQNFTIKKFPKLDHFLKRYQPEKNIVERVSVGNQVYQRRLLYSAQVFPEKTGKIKIDSMDLEVAYSQRGGNPFGNLGINIGPRSLKSKVIKSDTVYLEVLPLPAEGVPAGFTGLVGEHSFKLDINKTKFLLNEPLELKLKVTGPGALESLDAPSILTNGGLEEFDIKSNLELTDNFSGSKTFEYVFLTRAPFKTAAKNITLSYFDPEAMKYMSQTLTLPALEIVGQAIKAAVNSNQENTPLPKANDNFSDDGTMIIAPISSDKSFFNLKVINIGLILVILLTFIFQNKKLFYFKSSDTKRFLKEILKDNITYENLILLLKTYGQDFNSFKDFLKKSNLDEETKTYLQNLLRECEEIQFADKKESKKSTLKIQKRYLKKLIGILEK